MFGWTGKILKIDISSHQYEIFSPYPEIYHKYIGGKGLAGFYLKDHITRSWDDPEMPLLFFTGPLVATPSPTSGRMTVMSRSPLTGTIGDASVGGRFGTQLKKAGFDGIIITGKSKNLIGIEITDHKIAFIIAENFKGRTISEINLQLKGRGSYAAVGPAAENNVRFANIIFDGHYAAGRSGLGLVFSEKNLKYITVSGAGKTKIYNIEALKKANEDIFRLAAASPALMGELGITNFGTAALYDLTSNRHMMPTDNFKKTCFEKSKQLNANAYKKIYQPKKTGCAGCHILCKKIGKSGEVLPEFETMNHFSALLNNDDISTAVEANRICNDMGMDTISAGATIACYAEIEGRDLLKEEILSLLTDIALGRGIGKDLGKGSFEYAAGRGKPEASMTVKKLELPAYDPRGAYGMALGYAVSTRGGCHLRAYPIANELLRKPVPTDRFSFHGKARIIKIAEDLNAVIDSMTACKFIFFGATIEEYSKAYSAITGIESSGQDLLKTGEQIYYNERIMNFKNGFTRKDDDLPNRFFEFGGTGAIQYKMLPIVRKDFLNALENYYKIRGLDENGSPIEEKAKALGLSWEI